MFYLFYTSFLFLKWSAVNHFSMLISKEHLLICRFNLHRDSTSKRTLNRYTVALIFYWWVSDVLVCGYQADKSPTLISISSQFPNRSQMAYYTPTRHLNSKTASALAWWIKISALKTLLLVVYAQVAIQAKPGFVFILVCRRGSIINVSSRKTSANTAGHAFWRSHTRSSPLSAKQTANSH